MGLPLAAQFASHGWSVIAVDIDPAVVAGINEGRSHVADEPGLAELVSSAHAEGRLRATLDGAAAAADADVVVLIVPVMLDETSHPDHRSMDAAVAAIGGGVHAGSTVIFETTLPVGDTRDPVRAGPGESGGTDPRGGPVRRLLARAPLQRRGTPQPRHLPEARRRARPGLDGPRRGVLRQRPRRGRRRHVVGGERRVRQAGRHDLPGRQHRAGQPVRALRRPDRDRCARGHRGREQPAVQPHPPARPGGRWSLHPGLPAFPARPRSRARPRRARPAGQRRPGRGGHRGARGDARTARRRGRSWSSA